MKSLCRVFSLLICSLIAFSVSAAKFDEAQIKERFAKIGVSVTEVESLGIDGLVEVTTNQGTFYATPKGDYFIPGKLYSLDDDGNFKDVTAARLGPKIAAQLESLSDEMIVYKAKDEKYVVTVFTDTSCGYCLKLHRQMDEYNKLGITVRYLAFPRSGPQSQVAQQMANIWCHDDPAQAMSDMKLRGKNAEVSTDNIKQCQSIITKHYQVGKSVGVSGTPAVYTSKGINVGGYLSPKDLLARLQSQN
ncbi:MULTISPECIES: bifunctional protein-disulfide isomerase/oxidoreductase DsbC [Vibrio]|uniref:Thiol:disulfide interchange protein n=1 Tax=Vibrio halioticoli NBRC 102217 TaxID=1219072 RepID=V5FMU8_9VIBR|nr:MULTISPECIES: bifunctional protein-disulfide isomerase/oxidoreductase DsbC [Vibrio]MPW36816.1 bifunctional protein-disulfide isomerase/oxidoreductase DsbC [Vibrio sp. B1Z05]GAD90162.1 thiol--disulfide interchange protein DsbC [Vibrio halioticoli NBRC 102217]